jgi:hypothetical protein
LAAQHIKLVPEASGHICLTAEQLDGKELVMKKLYGSWIWRLDHNVLINIDDWHVLIATAVLFCIVRLWFWPAWLNTDGAIASTAINCLSGLAIGAFWIFLMWAIQGFATRVSWGRRIGRWYYSSYRRQDRFDEVMEDLIKEYIKLLKEKSNIYFEDDPKLRSYHFEIHACRHLGNDAGLMNWVFDRYKDQMPTFRNRWTKSATKGAK